MELDWFLRILFVVLAIIRSGCDGSRTCGRTPVPPTTDGRIVGGRVARPYSWPWQIALCRKGTAPLGSLVGADCERVSGWFGCPLFCGGSLLNNAWVMTAAHCVHGSANKPFLFQVKLGVFVHSHSSERGQVLSDIAQIVVHPSYDPHSMEYDVALLKLKHAVEYTDHIQPVCLPASDEQVLARPSRFWATGWGTTKFSGRLSEQLRQVRVPFVEQRTCEEEYVNEINGDVMFCAGVGGKDSCQGDSGGPLVLKRGAAWFQYGIVSFGKGCARDHYPGND